MLQKTDVTRSSSALQPVVNVSKLMGGIFVNVELLILLSLSLQKVLDSYK